MEIADSNLEVESTVDLYSDEISDNWWGGRKEKGEPTRISQMTNFASC